MSQIEKQIANSLFDSNGTSSGASDCYKIALEYIAGFAEWTSRSEWLFIRKANFWISVKDDISLSTDQLIDKYLEHLETIK